MQLISISDQPHVEDVCVHGVEQSPSKLGGNNLGVETERRYFALTCPVQIITVNFEKENVRFFADSGFSALEQWQMKYYRLYR